MGFKNGQHVEIVRTGFLYTTYQEMARVMGLRYFVNGYSAESGVTGEVVGKARHLDCDETLYGVRLVVEGEAVEILISGNGLKETDKMVKKVNGKLCRGGLIEPCKLKQGDKVFVQGVPTVNPNIPWEVYETLNPCGVFCVFVKESEDTVKRQLINIGTAPLQVYRAVRKRVTEKRRETRKADAPTDKLVITYGEDGRVTSDHTINGLLSHSFQENGTLVYFSKTSTRDSFETKTVTREGEVPLNDVMHVTLLTHDGQKERHHLTEGKIVRKETFYK